MTDNAVDRRISVSWPLIGTLAAMTFCHAVWNALVYTFWRCPNLEWSIRSRSRQVATWEKFGTVPTFFGYGTSAAALGVSQYNLYDPERGLLGVALNSSAAAILWRWTSRRNRTL